MTFLDIIFELSEVLNASQTDIKLSCKHSSSFVSHSPKTNDVSGESEALFSSFGATHPQNI